MSRTRPRLRPVAVALALLTALGLVAGCDSEFTGVHLKIAAGNPGGVYDNLAQGLANAWQSQLGVDRPEVLATGGSPDNVTKLRTGAVDIAFTAADVATEPYHGSPAREPRALARIYDDYLHIVVRADSPIHALADLRGRRVAVGAKESGVEFIAHRLLELSGLSAPGAVTQRSLDLEGSVQAFKDNQVDAFFWSGGLPTKAVAKLSDVVQIRLLDLADDIPRLRLQYPVYNAASIPASTYNLAGKPVNTLAVPNFLVVSDAMPDDVAEALVRGLFEAQPGLAESIPAALAIDVHSAIETDPVKLHPGAVRYYQQEKV
ncbi:TAXI family TRAP transporter solute-binding subunit [Actinokineospora sp. NBRC 105648]|uniref:TAXI family TRAP transporter solute-binding subunit n=1 Tax=Actinokineospora sp. NBRC 105648 TaxID=3032206 RepID=UPI0024A1AB87|nr:TAXI family TRAP transporter solute-binding subunit [Actinokineospora sp. NBRC 105648]GLZ38649.1 C4-dicarboxylate ABC transporter substrate-binding protein [Actinokineospora sp. NBRC 105648]